jgi:gas vesicle protein
VANDNGSGSNVLIGFVIGAALGAAVALLLAPASGAETRRKMADKARQGREKAEALARESGEFLRRQRDKVAAAAEEL